MSSIAQVLKKNVTSIGLGLLLLICAWFIYGQIFGDAASTLADSVNTQTWIDVDGQAFEHELVAFDDSPVVGPTGKPAFRAELCYWTRDGKTKSTPTPVLLNSYAGKPEPTFCPDCGRLVTALNPSPPTELTEGQSLRPPPTQSDMGK